MSNAQYSSRETRWAGEFLGLPESGPASAASYPRRIGALFVDWFIASGIGLMLASGNQWLVLGVFVVLHFALLWLFATTLGKIAISHSSCSSWWGHSQAVPGSHPCGTAGFGRTGPDHRPRRSGAARQNGRYCRDSNVISTIPTSHQHYRGLRTSGLALTCGLDASGKGQRPLEYRGYSWAMRKYAAQRHALRDDSMSSSYV